MVEDDPYGRLRYEGGHILPLRALDPDVIYLGTFSKIFAPGLRLGLDGRAAPDTRRRCCSRSRAPTCAAPRSRRRSPERYMTGTAWRRVLADLTRTYRERRDAMLGGARRAPSRPT